MVQINGEQQDVALVAGKTLLAYVTEAGYDPVGIVIEKNMEIIHREDFDKVSIEDGVYFTLDRPSHYDERSAEEGSLPSSMALWLQDLAKYNFMAMPKADAKKFLQNRKKYDGSINRSILLVIHYTIADFSGKDYTAVKAKFAKSRETPILGIISSIEVYDENNNKIGDLTKK